MTEALLNEPQTPTDGKPAAQPAATQVTPPQATPPTDASKDAVQPPVDSSSSKQTPPAAPLKSLLNEPEKAGDKAPAEGDKKPADAAKAPASGPPEKYEWKNDGEAKVAAPVLSAYEKAVREAGLSQDTAQKMLDSLRTTAFESAKSQHESLVRSWADELSADPILGGDHLEETGANMRAALAEFGSPALRELLLNSGLGHNIEIARLLSSVKKKVGGDRIVTGAPPKGNADDQAKQFYGAMPKV